MRIVLIYVHSDGFSADYVLEERSKRGPTQIIGFPPLGIMALSAVLKREGHECIMFDQRNPETPNDVIVDEIQRLQPDLVGLSCLSAPIYANTKNLARQIRAANAKVKIAFGGVFATLNALRIMKDCPEVDYVCSGDGEQLILDLLDNLEDPSNVRSVTWTDEGGTIRQTRARTCGWSSAAGARATSSERAGRAAWADGGRGPARLAVGGRPWSGSSCQRRT